MAELKCKKAKFGLLGDGTKVHLFTISNGKMSFSCTDYGCTLTSIIVPARGGKKIDVLLGCSSLDGYINSQSCFGTIVGRFANRISGATFMLDGIRYNLEKNERENSLHGGFDRYEKKVWKGKKIRTENGLGVQFTRYSYDGEQGMPGNVKIKVIYTLNEQNEITLEYFAESDKATPINLTNHAYFNLRGQDSGSIEPLELQMDCSEFLEVDNQLFPTGAKINVKDAPAFDFTKAKTIGKDIAQTGDGYDHAFCIDGSGDKKLRLFAKLKDPESGRSMTMATTEPAVQIYTGNFIEGLVGKNGTVYHKHDAICMEAEAYPDAPNKSQFPSCILRPGEEYHQVTKYAFSL